MTDRKKILFIRFSSIGDIVLTTPVIRCVKQQLGMEVHFLTKESYASVLHANPYIDQIVTIREDIGEVTSALKAFNYDWIADLHHNLRSARLKSVLRRPGATFPKLNVEKWLLTNFRIDRLPDRHLVDRYFETVNDLGVVNDGKGLDFFISAEDHMDMAAMFGEDVSEGQFIAMAIGAGRPTKNLEDAQWLELIGRVGKPVVLLGGAHDKTRGEWLAIQSDNCVNCAGTLRLGQSASVISQALALIAPDTGLMHIGAALKKPVFSIWGNTIPGFGMTPYYPQEMAVAHREFEVRDLSCRPCSKIGYQRCPRGHFRCIREIRMADIANAVAMLKM